ncbi:MAG: asparaginase domain-containing protein [Nanoarchaeota archaeon]
MTVKIFITGGTIDGLEYDSEEKAPKKFNSIIPKILKEARIKTDFGAKILIFKDSKFVTGKDRETILKKCRGCKEDKIIITHGTMTMPLTAKFLEKFKINKTIVLTGSAIPARGKNSDAKFNLGFAMAAVQTLPAGVYVAMNGNIFSSTNVKKNLKTGFFEKEK